jgi:hypothetical protein
MRSYDVLKRAAVLLIVCDVLLVFAYLLDVALGYPSWTFNRLVNLDAEGTVAVWYTSAKLLGVGLLFLGLGVSANQSGARRPVVDGNVYSAVPPMGSKAFCGSVAVAFFALSLHELVTVSLRRFEFLPRFSGNHGMWIPFLVVGVVAFLAATMRSWQRLWRGDRRGALLMGLGLAMGLAGAVLLEIVSYEVIRPRDARALYAIEVAVEEGLEMMGASLLLIGSAHVYRSGTGVPASVAASRTF